MSRMPLRKITFLATGVFCLYCLVSQNRANAQHFMTAPQTASNPKISELKAKAEAGDTGAQKKLGNAYMTGKGVKQDYAKAMVWIEKAALQGDDPEAKNSLGFAYFYGIGGKERNLVKSVALFKQAALQGDSYGEANLGEAYYRGTGVEKNCDEATYWLEQAIAQKNEGAERGLAYLYERGICVTKNTEMALDLYQKSCNHGNKMACYYYKDLKNSAG